MPVIDMDKARAARREADQVPPTVIFGGQTFELPVELPLDVVDEFVAMFRARSEKDNEAAGRHINAAIELLLGDGFPAFKALRPSAEDYAALLDGLMVEYGADLGESSASES
jgi:hypothetical protein